LFFFSILGIFWTLRSLQKESESDLIGERRENQDDQKMSAEAKAHSFYKESAPALQTLTDQLDRIEAVLTNIERKLDQTGLSGAGVAAAELKNILQSLKSNPDAAGAIHLGQIASKVDKIYQVLTELSGTEEGK
jgi:hypothetical protein